GPTLQDGSPVASVCRDDRAPTSFPTRRSSDLRSDADGDAVSLHYVWKNGTIVVRDVTKSAGTAADLTDSLNLATAGNGDKGNTIDRKSTRMNSSHSTTTYAAICSKQNSAPVAT